MMDNHKEPRVTEQADEQEGVAGLRPYEFSVCGKSLRWYLKRDVDALLTRQAAPGEIVGYIRDNPEMIYNEGKEFSLRKLGENEGWRALTYVRQAAPEAPTDRQNMTHADMLALCAANPAAASGLPLKRPAATQQAGAAELCDCCADIRAAEAIHGDGPAATTASAADPAMYQGIEVTPAPTDHRFAAGATTASASGHNDTVLLVERLDQPGFEVWATSHGGLPLDLAGDAMRTDDGLALPTYKFGRTEIAWRAWASSRAQAPSQKREAAPMSMREAFDTAFLSLNGFHTKSELERAWAPGTLSGEMFRAGYHAALAQQGAAQANSAPEKAMFWFSCLTKCARLLDLPDDEPIPSGVVDAVEKLVAAQAAHAGASDLRMLIANIQIPEGSKQFQHGFVSAKESVLAAIAISTKGEKK